MTGPPYPPPPGPGSNAVGTFRVGIDQVGDIPPFQWWRTVISQYANSPVIVQLIQGFDECVDQTQNLTNFFDLIWNVDTAQGYGLDVWGRIVGVNRVLTVITPLPAFGFEEALPGSTGWNQASFYSGATLTDNFTLSDQAYRRLILAKAFANISDGSIKSINQLLLNLFPHRGNCFVRIPLISTWFGFTEAVSTPNHTEGWNIASFYSGQGIVRMAIEYVFKFPLSELELAIVQVSGVLPRPVGVLASVVIEL